MPTIQAPTVEISTTATPPVADGTYGYIVDVGVFTVSLPYSTTNVQIAAALSNDENTITIVN
jgi:hypothetical protein